MKSHLSVIRNIYIQDEILFLENMIQFCGKHWTFKMGWIPLG